MITLFFFLKKEKGYAGDEIRTRVDLRHRILSPARLAGSGTPAF
jgi:hypothetical protein